MAAVAESEGGVPVTEELRPHRHGGVLVEDGAWLDGCPMCKAHRRAMTEKPSPIEALDEANTDLARSVLSLSSSLSEKIERVSELEAELEGRIADDSVLCPHAPKHVLEAKLRELETERERLDEVNTGLASQILRLMQERDSALGLLHD